VSRWCQVQQRRLSVKTCSLQARFLRWLPRSRYADGYHACWCSCDGRGLTFSCGKLTLSPTTDKRASNCRRYYEIRAHYRLAEQDWHCMERQKHCSKVARWDQEEFVWRWWLISPCNSDLSLTEVQHRCCCRLPVQNSYSKARVQRSTLHDCD